MEPCEVSKQGLATVFLAQVRVAGRTEAEQSLPPAAALRWFGGSGPIWCSWEHWLYLRGHGHSRYWSRSGCTDIQLTLKVRCALQSRKDLSGAQRICHQVLFLRKYFSLPSPLPQAHNTYVCKAQGASVFSLPRHLPSLIQSALPCLIHSWNASQFSFYMYH